MDTASPTQLGILSYYPPLEDCETRHHHLKRIFEAEIMPVKKIKIEVNDAEGNKITASFQGRIPREKVVKLLDLLELMGGVSNDQPNQKALTNMSKYEKLQLVLKRRLPIGWFSIQDAIIAYEDTLNEPIKVSTTSTYLSRLTKAGFLSKSGSRGNHQFRIKDVTSIFETHKVIS